MINGRSFYVRAATLKWWCIDVLCVSVCAIVYQTVHIQSENNRVLFSIVVGLILVAMVLASRFSGIKVMPEATSKPAKRWPFVVCTVTGMYGWGMIVIKTTGAVRYLSVLILAAVAANWFFFSRQRGMSAKASQAPRSI